MPHYIFSTGLLTANGVAGAAGADVSFAVLQSISVDTSYQEKQMFTVPVVSNYAVNSGTFGGRAQLKCKIASFSAAAMNALAGALLDANGGATFSRVFSLPSFTAILKTRTSTGCDAILTCPNVRASGAALSLRQEDWLENDFVLSAYPDVATGIVEQWEIICPDSGGGGGGPGTPGTPSLSTNALPGANTPAGTYWVVLTFLGADFTEGPPSAAASVDVGAGESIVVAAPTSYPAGTQSVNIYVGDTNGSPGGPFYWRTAPSAIGFPPGSQITLVPLPPPGNPLS